LLATVARSGLVEVGTLPGQAGSPIATRPAGRKLVTIGIVFVAVLLHSIVV